MKDVTSTTFGLLIAYLLPGVVGFHALAERVPSLEQLLQSFLAATSSVGLFFYVALVALVIGIQLSAFRWLVFECVLFPALSLCFPKLKLSTKGLKREKLRQGDTLVSFRALVDEQYRYHQFWGALSIAIPIWFLAKPVPIGEDPTLWMAIAVVIEAITVVAAIAAYDRHVRYAEEFLS